MLILQEVKTFIDFRLKRNDIYYFTTLTKELNNNTSIISLMDYYLKTKGKFYALQFEKLYKRS